MFSQPKNTKYVVLIPKQIGGSVTRHALFAERSDPLQVAQQLDAPQVQFPRPH